jgi:hypothetical protein
MSVIAWLQQLCERRLGSAYNRRNMRPSSLKERAGWRWGIAGLAGLIGTISLCLLVMTVPRMFADYVLFPLVKDAYIYPEWRYRIFDTVLFSWCVDGLIAGVLLSRNVTVGARVTGWARRTTELYFIGFAILLAGVMLGVWLRSHGI